MYNCGYPVKASEKQLIKELSYDFTRLSVLHSNELSTTTSQDAGRVEGLTAQVAGWLAGYIHVWLHARI